MSSYEISKSSLLSLKAEILRKQEELAQTKIENIEKIKSIKKKSLDLKNKGVEDRQLKDLNDEEQDLLKLSKSKLEAKSKLYDKLSGKSQENSQYLVRFDKKKKISDQSHSDADEAPDLPVDSEDEETHLSDYYDDDINPCDEWVEYTDCLGRSRKCLRKDLEYIKSRDADLKQPAVRRQQTAAFTSTESCQESITETKDENYLENEGASSQTADDEREMISGDMRRDMLRKQWEREEDELRDKTDIHYQNILFNEARQHGVGYYAFAKDQDERTKQQDALKQLRVETAQQQKKAQDLKALREKQMAARMKAARNRKRARLGLPPEEDEVVSTSEPSVESEEEAKKKEENEKLAETENMLMEARKRHVRPWDIGKEGVTEFYQMTQEEWNVKKRQERPAEFAPPVAYSTREFSSVRLLEHNIDDSDKSLRFSSKGRKDDKINKRKLRNINPYKNLKMEEYDNSENNFENNDRLMEDFMQSEAFNSGKNNTYEPEDPTSEVEEDNLLSHYQESLKVVDNIKSTPIINEVETTDFDDAFLADYPTVVQNIIPDEEDRLTKKRTEIAPPPSFEYFGPTSTKKIKHSTGQINIADSIDAGLKFLRNQAERKRRRRDDPL